MSNETVVAAPSAAEDVFEGQQPTLEEYNRYREDGTLPDSLKPAEPADPAPADPPKEAESEGDEPESEPEPEPEKNQEQQPETRADKRIKQLLAQKKELEAQLAAKQDVKTEPSSAPEQQFTRPKPTADDKKDDGSPKFETYEDFVEDLADWKGEQRDAKNTQERAQQDAVKALESEMVEARKRYADADDVIIPTGKAIQEAQIPQGVKEVFAHSKSFLDLCYAVGSDPEGLKGFIELSRTDPRAALGKIFEYERAIAGDKPRDASGKFVAPEPKKTAAPKPPSPVGGGASRGFDVNDESLSPDEWMHKRNQELSRKT